MKYFLTSVLCFIVLTHSVKAQDKAFAKNVIDTLCQPYFAGRGYVDDGDLKAAQFIVKKFHDAGLQTFSSAKDYIQPFNMPVNTFPGKMKVEIDGKELVPGQDYIVDPVSGGCSLEKLTLVNIDSLWLTQILKGYPGKLPRKNFAIVLDKKLLEKTISDNSFEKISALNPSAIISVNDGRLIWSVGATPIDIPFIEIKKKHINALNKSIVLEIDEKEMEHSTQNITGFVKGSVYPDSFVFFTAHYDHLGKMGEHTYFPGANDNASGVAMMLDLARYFAKPENRPKYSIGFIAFAGEEAGLVGSKFYTDHPVEPLSNISFLINVDLMANGQDGMMVVNGSVFPKQYDRLVFLNDSGHYLKSIQKRGKAANSDHYWFSEKGVKAFFFYLLGDYPYYHDIYDTPDKPTMAGYDGAFGLIRDFVMTYGR